MKYLVSLLIIGATSFAFAGPVDNCYAENADLKEASLCADKVLARRIKKLRNTGDPSGLTSCTLTVCVWGDFTDPEDRHDGCSKNTGEWKYANIFIEARNKANAIDIFAEKYEDTVEARAAVLTVTCD